MTHNHIWEFSFKKYWYNELSKNMEQRMKWKWILLYSPLMPSTSYQLPPLSTTHMLIHAVHPKNSDLTIIHYPNLQQRKTNRRATKWKNQVFVLADFWTNIFSTTSCCLCPTLPRGPRIKRALVPTSWQLTFISHPFLLYFGIWLRCSCKVKCQRAVLLSKKRWSYLKWNPHEAQRFSVIISTA